MNSKYLGKRFGKSHPFCLLDVEIPVTCRLNKGFLGFPAFKQMQKRFLISMSLLCVSHAALLT
jgi:hypothetical protein